MEKYVLTAEDVDRINHNRQVANAIAGGVGHTHAYNDVAEGDEFPLIVVREWEDGKVNGQVILDGNDTLWVTSVDKKATEPSVSDSPEDDPEATKSSVSDSPEDDPEAKKEDN